MSLIIYALLFLPFFTSLMWLCLSVMRRGKSLRQRLLVYTLLFTTLYFYVDGNWHIAQRAFPRMVLLDILGCFASLEIPSCLIAYARSLAGKKPGSPLSFSLLLPGFVVLALMAGSVVAEGLPGAADFYSKVYLTNVLPEGDFSIPNLIYFYTSFYLYDLLMLVNLLFALWVLFKVLRENVFSFRRFLVFMRGGAVSSLNAFCLVISVLLMVCAVKISLGDELMLSNRYLAASFAAIISILIFLTAYISLNLESTPVSWKSFGLPLAPVQSTSIVQPVAFLSAPKTKNDDDDDFAISKELADRLVEYFEGGKAYLDPDLSIDSVASELNTNRTYVSIFVNQYYNLTFRAFINDRRIKAAKRILMDEPQCTLEDIAGRCGFQSVSQFSRKFKEIEGKTPREWQTSVNLQN